MDSSVTAIKVTEETRYIKEFHQFLANAYRVFKPLNLSGGQTIEANRLREIADEVIEILEYSQGRWKAVSEECKVASRFIDALKAGTNGMKAGKDIPFLKGAHWLANYIVKTKDPWTTKELMKYWISQTGTNDSKLEPDWSYLD
ncbi:MAG: hypothetical protein ACXAEI_05570, partial [Candidatus Hodarchaeales archaeon]